jgi:hypothetical protein
MRIYKGEVFADIFDGRSILPFRRRSGRVVEGMEFRRCRFESCTLSAVLHPTQRTVVRDFRLFDCSERGCLVGPVVAEEVLIDGLGTGDLLQTWGAVFRHVTLRGRIGRVMTSSIVDISSDDPRPQRLFDEANARYYETVDWALDISEAEFEEADIRGVPARLIRRDPETQVVVTRERALEGRWRELDLSGTYWDTYIEFMLDRGDDDVVLIASRRAHDFQPLLEGLRLLREAGVAEPD